MSQPPFRHVPVMVSEVLAALATVPAGVVLDATVGAGGHASAILESRPDLSVVALDRDPDAVAVAASALRRFGSRAVVLQARFETLHELLDSSGVGLLSGAVFDLGVSSAQLERPERGFSYRLEGPLDMRMDPTGNFTAADVVNHWTSEQLTAIFAAAGEVRFASRMARAVVAARPLSTTTELAAVVSGAVPAQARRRGHPARRVFQALRIAVNEELTSLPAAIDQALSRLAPGGRCCVISYHSGEDRIVKERFDWAATGGCTCPPGLGCVCGARPLVRLSGRGARKPTAQEVALNPRADSARLRVAEKL
jgi:16S rRNA (cytosine1402-N4)-methyltransferase